MNHAMEALVVFEKTSRKMVSGKKWDLRPGRILYTGIKIFMNCSGLIHNGKSGKHSVQVYGNEFDKLKGAGMIKSVSGEIREFYELVSEEQYTEDMGLDLGVDSVDSGMVILM